MSDGANFLATPSGVEFVHFPAGPRAPDPVPPRPFCGHWQMLDGRIFGMWRYLCGQDATSHIPDNVAALLRARNPFNPTED